MQITLEMGSGFTEAVATLGAMGRDIAAAMKDGLRLAGQIGEGNVNKNYLQGQALKHRTGFLAKSVQSWTEGDDTVVIGVRPGSAVDRYKWLLGDEEKTITPKKGQYLAIPIGEALAGSGATKAKYQVPLRSIDGGFFVRTHGRLLFGIKRGKKGKFRPLFTLVKSVFVQGSDALFDGVDESTDNMTAAIQQSIDRKIAS